MIFVSLLLLVGIAALPTVNTFIVVPNVMSRTTTSSISLLSLFPPQQHCDEANNPMSFSARHGDDDKFRTRREIFYSAAKIGTAMLLGIDSFPVMSNAAPISDGSEAASATAVAMKTFVDPEGLFIINIPQRFFAIRRTNQGDLPNAATGSGRRGSSIFNAGDLAKAEVLAIERFPARVLLEDYGIEATGSLKTFPDIGEPSTIANLIAIRRDREKPMATSSNGSAFSKSPIVPNSLSVSQDGRELSFLLKTNIDVQKPDLLMEQSGVNVLNRMTAAKVSLRSNDGYIMAVFASALESDWQGVDGIALQDAVSSFDVIDQSVKIEK